MASFLQLFAGFGTLFLIGVTGVLIYQLAPEAGRRQALWAEVPWLGKGLLLPFFLWILMNIGLSFELQPFMPSIQQAQNAGAAWLPAFLKVIISGLFLITTYWAALTIGWTTFRMSRELQGEAAENFRGLCLTCAVAGALPIIGLLWLGGWFTLGVAALLIVLPIAGYGQTYLRPPKQRPMYSRAIARLKFGKYSEAEWEIIQQLEHAENDFDGWLMLADLQANHFKDIAEAEQIILDICHQPGVTSSQVSVALHKLADWQLSIADNPEAADRALQAISILAPSSHLARMAELRRAQLPRNVQELQAQRQRRPIPVPPVPSLFAVSAPASLASEPEPPGTPVDATATALREVEQLTQSLTQDPNQISTREKLACLLATPVGRADLAIEQINLLLGLHNQPPPKRAEWLMLIAKWQAELLRDETAARATLEQIIAEFPRSPQGFTAQRQLSLMNAESGVRKNYSAHNS